MDHEEDVLALIALDLRAALSNKLITINFGQPKKSSRNTFVIDVHDPSCFFHNLVLLNLRRSILTCTASRLRLEFDIRAIDSIERLLAAAPAIRAELGNSERRSICDWIATHWHDYRGLYGSRLSTRDDQIEFELVPDGLTRTDGRSATAMRERRIVANIIHELDDPTFSVQIYSTKTEFSYSPVGLTAAREYLEAKIAFYGL